MFFIFFSLLQESIGKGKKCCTFTACITINILYVDKKYVYIYFLLFYTIPFAVNCIVRNWILTDDFKKINNHSQFSFWKENKTFSGRSKIFPVTLFNFFFQKRKKSHKTFWNPMDYHIILTTSIKTLLQTLKQICTPYVLPILQVDTLLGQVWYDKEMSLYLES